MAETEPELCTVMREVALTLDDIFNGDERGANRKIGFIVLTFPYGVVDGARTNYISNGADRKEIAILLREQAAKFDGQPDDIVGHG